METSGEGLVTTLSERSGDPLSAGGPCGAAARHRTRTIPRLPQARSVLIVVLAALCCGLPSFARTALADQDGKTFTTVISTNWTWAKYTKAEVEADNPMGAPPTEIYEIPKEQPDVEFVSKEYLGYEFKGFSGNPPHSYVRFKYKLTFKRLDGNAEEEEGKADDDDSDSKSLTRQAANLMSDVADISKELAAISDEISNSRFAAAHSSAGKVASYASSARGVYDRVKKVHDEVSELHGTVGSELERRFDKLESEVRRAGKHLDEL